MANNHSLTPLDLSSHLSNTCDFLVFLLQTALKRSLNFEISLEIIQKYEKHMQLFWKCSDDYRDKGILFSWLCMGCMGRWWVSLYIARKHINGVFAGISTIGRAWLKNRSDHFNVDVPKAGNRDFSIFQDKCVSLSTIMGQRMNGLSWNVQDRKWYREQVLTFSGCYESPSFKTFYRPRPDGFTLLKIAMVEACTHRVLIVSWWLKRRYSLCGIHVRERLQKLSSVNSEIYVITAGRLSVFPSVYPRCLSRCLC